MSSSTYLTDGADASARAHLVCAAEGLSGLSSRACTVLRSASSSGAFTASAVGAALTSLITICSALQVARVLVWPVCFCLVLLALFAATSSLHLLLRPLTGASDRTQCSSVPENADGASDIASETSTLRHKISEASLLLADSYLLLPEIMTLPDSPFELPDKSALISDFQLINTAPFRCPFSFPKSRAKVSDPMPNDANINSEIRPKYIIGHATCRSNRDGIYQNTDLANFDLRTFVKNIQEKSVNMKETENTYDIRSKSPAHPASDISITLSNFCLPAHHSSGLMLPAEPTAVKSNHLGSSPCSDEQIENLSCVSRPIIGFFTPDTNSFVLPSKLYRANGETLRKKTSNTAWSNSSECYVLIIPSGNNSLRDTQPRSSVESLSTILAPKICLSSRGTNFGVPMNSSDCSVEECTYDTLSSFDLIPPIRPFSSIPTKQQFSDTRKKN